MITQAAYNQVLSAISILLTIYTVYLAYDIYKYNRFSKGWLFVIAGYSLAVVRRGVVYLNAITENPDMSAKLTLLESHFAILGIATFVIGFWWIRKDFSRWQAISDGTDTKMAAMQTARKRKKRSRR